MTSQGWWPIRLVSCGKDRLARHPPQSGEARGPPAFVHTHLLCVSRDILETPIDKTKTIFATVGVTLCVSRKHGWLLMSIDSSGEPAPQSLLRESNGCLLSTYFVMGTIMGTWDTSSEPNKQIPLNSRNPTKRGCREKPVSWEKQQKRKLGRGKLLN